MNKFALRSFALAACTAGVAMLTACGGGGGGGGGSNPPAADTSNDPIAKYIGGWASTCIDLGEGDSAKLNPVFSKTGAKSANISGEAFAYSNTTCSGNPAEKAAVSGSITLVDTVTVGGKTVDRSMFNLSLNEPWYQGKNITLVEGTTMKIGNTSSALVDGYPTALNTTLSFTKR